MPTPHGVFPTIPKADEAAKSISRDRRPFRSSRSADTPSAANATLADSGPSRTYGAPGDCRQFPSAGKSRRRAQTLSGRREVAQRVAPGRLPAARLGQPKTRRQRIRRGAGIARARRSKIGNACPCAERIAPEQWGLDDNQSGYRKATAMGGLGICSRAICAVSETHTRAKAHRLVYSRIPAIGAAVAIITSAESVNPHVNIVQN